jgi:hypothetical protein
MPLNCQLNKNQGKFGHGREKPRRVHFFERSFGSIIGFKLNTAIKI